MLRPRKVKHPPIEWYKRKSSIVVFERENPRQLVIEVESLFHLLLAHPVAHVDEMLLTRVLSLRVLDALLEHARGVVDLTHRFHNGVVDIEHGCRDRYV